MNRRQYVADVRRQLVHFYRRKRDGHCLSDEQRGRIEGFMQAGVSLEIFTERQRDRLIADVYEQVFSTEDSCVSMIEHYQQSAPPGPMAELKSEPPLKEGQQQTSGHWRQDEVRDYSEYESSAFDRLVLHRNSGY